ncbi:hypothetical protein BDR04DRAFT_1109009 [Suillus decipiens]|nr:hypothetical protein BDR04DRAFT_1109009 [Suillus decipiens]
MPFANFAQIRSNPTNLLLLVALGQTVVVCFAWGFMGEVWLTQVLPLPDKIVNEIVKYPTKLTLIVTLISTVLAIISSMLFAYAVKEALRRHLSGPITLFKLRTAIALSKLTWVLRWKSFKLSVITLAVYAVITLLHSSWSTLLLPTVIQWPVGIVGTELDLGSVAFVNQLSTDLFEQNANSVQAPAFQTINILTLVSGVAAIGIQRGVQVNSSMFSFNGVSYSQSTGGILPAIEEYSGSSDPPGSDVGLAFSGGKVPVNTNFEWEHLGRDPGTHQGTAQNYSVTQQGVTANVTCQSIDLSQNSFAAVNVTVPGPEVAFVTWGVTANCSGNLNSEFFFTAANATTGQMDSESEGFLPTVVCPNPNSTATFNPNKFNIFMSGHFKYDFLPTTVCEVVPYLTTVNVTYNGGIVSVDRVGTYPGLTSSPNLPLSQYIATVIAYQAVSNQGMTSNPIGDFLTVYGTSNVSVMYNELEDYWRGIVEFASTQLRSGYTAAGVPSNMTRATSGTMYVITYGWQSEAYTYIYLLVVITLVWGTTIFAVGYALIQEKIHPSDPSFDFTDPVDLIIATSGGRHESELCGGDKEKVDDISVRFEDIPEKAKSIISKKLVIVPESELEPV